MIVGVVGVLQIDVMVECMVNEYGFDVVFEEVFYNVVCWIYCDDDVVLMVFFDKNKLVFGIDLDDVLVYLVKNVWDVGYVQEKNLNICFLVIKE